MVRNEDSHVSIFKIKFIFIYDITLYNDIDMTVGRNLNVYQAFIQCKMVKSGCLHRHAAKAVHRSVLQAVIGAVYAMMMFEAASGAVPGMPAVGTGHKGEELENEKENNETALDSYGNGVCHDFRHVYHRGVGGKGR